MSARRRPRRRREEWVRNVTFLISNYARAWCDCGTERTVDSIIARPEIKTQSRWLAEFCRRMLRAPKVCRNAKHLRQMCQVRMLLNSSRLQLKGARAPCSAVNEPAGCAMIDARDRLIVDGRECKECIYASLLHLTVSVAWILMAGPGKSFCN